MIRWNGTDLFRTSSMGFPAAYVRGLRCGSSKRRDGFEHEQLRLGGGQGPIFIALNCLENCFSIARFYAGDDLGEILW
jgi:hypothetical protein